MRTDRRTDMTKLIVAFRYFANVLKSNITVKAAPCVILGRYVSEAEQRELRFE